MKYTNGRHLGCYCAGIVCTLAGSAFGFEKGGDALGTLDLFIDTLETREALALPGAEEHGVAARTDSLRVSQTNNKGVVPIDTLLDRAMPLPGVIGPSVGYSIARAIEKDAFEEARKNAARREKARQYTDRAFKLDPTPRNFRGQRIDHAAPVRYIEDFEDEARGEEWAVSSKLTDGDSYTRFLGPVRQGEQVLYVRVDPGEAYTLKFDLYLIGVPKQDFDQKAEIKVMVDGVPLATLGYDELRRVNARLNGSEPGFDEDIARELLVPFVAGGSVVEICFCGGSEMVLSPGSWGLDNVVIDKTPTNPGVVGGGAGAPIALGDEGGVGGGSPRSFAQSNPFERPRRFQPSSGGGGGGGRRTPFDFSDFFDPPEPEDPPLDDPPTDEPPTDDPPPPPPPDGPDPPDDPEVPAPGTLFLGPALALAAMRRRRPQD